MNLTITIPRLPPSELNPNQLRRTHWSVRSKAEKAAREEIGWLAKAQHHDSPAMQKARISYEFHAKDKRKRDLDNLLSACKPWQDGLIDAGIIFYDDAAHLEIGSVRLVQDGSDQTVITVEEV